VDGSPPASPTLDERIARKRLLSTEELPTLPNVVRRILEITGDPLSSTRQLTHLIERDPALSGNLLKLVNSAYFGFSRRIYQVHDAVVLVGYSTIRGLALGTSVITALKSGPNLDARHFWEHSLATAVGTDLVARELAHEKAEMAFIAGLLHDVGVLVMALAMPDRRWPPAGPEEADPLALEEAAYGMTHPAAGGAISRKWRFPPELTRAIEEHHVGHHVGARGDLATASDLARLVFLAEWLVEGQYRMAGDPVGSERDAAGVAVSLGHDLRTVLKVAPKLNGALGQVDAILSMGIV
jgi:putative nucleotidyltransferase with HDIG domain